MPPKAKQIKTTTVEDVAQMLRNSKITVDTAEGLLQGVRGSTVLSTVGSTDGMWDLESPDPNDTMHLETLRTQGIITPDDFTRLVSALN